MDDVLNKDEEVKEVAIEQEVKKTSDNAIKAVEKELKYEELAIQEEKMKEVQEE